MRDSTLNLPGDFNQWDQLENEADYWDISELKRLIKSKKSRQTNPDRLILTKSSDKISISGQTSLITQIFKTALVEYENEKIEKIGESSQKRNRTVSVDLPDFADFDEILLILSKYFVIEAMTTIKVSVT